MSRRRRGAGSIPSGYVFSSAESGGDHLVAAVRRDFGGRFAVVVGGGRIRAGRDEPAVRLLASRILKRAGYDVRVAADGVEACALFQEHSRERPVGVNSPSRLTSDSKGESTLFMQIMSSYTSGKQAAEMTDSSSV